MAISPFKISEDVTADGKKPSAWFHKWLDFLRDTVNTLRTDVDSNDTDIAALDTRLDTAESDIDTLQARVPTLGTPVATTSGTAIDFTSIPSWVTRIVINFVGVSTNGTDDLRIQIGDSGGIETSGYLGTASAIGASSVSSTLFTTGFGINLVVAAAVFHGSIELIRENSSSNTWCAAGVISRSDTASTRITSGSKSLSGPLDRLRVTTAGGTDTFDGSGEINIWYE